MFTFLHKLQQIWKIKDLRNKILFVLGMLVIFRIAAHIPISGVNHENLVKFFQGNQVLGFINVFSGGAMEQFSIVALGIAPYITASIIFQLLTMIIPRLEAISKEGESGYHRINQYTRLLTIPLAILQSYGLITILRQSQLQILPDFTTIELLITILSLTTGTVFLMWIGELISEQKIGNGISLLIFAGIIAQFPGSFANTIAVATTAEDYLKLVGFAIIGVISIIGVVIITEGQRKVPVSYAKRVRGNKMYGGVDTHLPLRVNQAGVIPIIFAISIILFPPIVAQFFKTSSVSFVQTAANFIIDIFNNTIFYGIVYFILVFLLTYFYTAVIFHPQKIAEHLQKQGGFIPGIRPGEQTAEYLQLTINRIILAGALFLGIIAVLPLIVPNLTGVSTILVGGTSLLIVISVIIETVQQINSQLTMRDYEGI